MNKKIALLATIIVLIAVVITSIYYNSPDKEFARTLEDQNEEVGPLEIEEEFTGPNTNYSRAPETNTEDLNLNFDNE